MPENGWVIWYEDVEGPGDLAIFLTEEAANNRIAELLLSLVAGLEGDVGEKDWEPGDPFPGDARKTAKQIRVELKKGNVSAALSAWEEFNDEYDAGTIHVNKADVYR
jgi:hypothetical protein